MSKKAGICESCNKSKTLYQIKKKDLTTGKVQETFHWWCNDCFDNEIRKAVIRP